MTDKIRCPHDGAICHHDCVGAGPCYRHENGMELRSPHTGYPIGKPAKVDDTLSELQLHQLANEERRTLEELRSKVDRFEAALAEVCDKEGECSAYYEKNDPGEPGVYCSCAFCVAKKALRYKGTGYDWRYRGIMHERINYNAGEARMVKAASHALDDRTLALILYGDRFNTWPTARDWFVAMSIIQWLATNIGSSVLENAGYKYTKYKEDRGLRESCKVSEFAQPDKPRHGHGAGKSD